MSIPNRFRPLCGGGVLPHGFTRLTACRFDQRQGFVTGVIDNADITLRADLKGNGYVTGEPPLAEMCVFSTRPNYGDRPVPNNNTYCALQPTAGVIEVRAFIPPDANQFLASRGINDRHVYTWSKSYVELDGKKITYSPTVYAKDINVGFGLDRNGRKLHADVYKLEIYKGAELLRRYVPAVAPNGRTCFFEVVEQKAVYSELEANFVPVY